MIKEFIFQGFDPEQKTKDLAFKRFQKIYFSVPNDSIPKAFIEKQGKVFSGEVEIISNQGTFTAKASGQNPDSVINDLFQDVSEKLATWRKTRFL